MNRVTDFARRSPLARDAAFDGARFASIGDAAIVAEVPADRAATPGLAIVDLSVLPRIGIKGWRVWTELRARGVRTPSVNNTAVALVGGGVCARLGEREALILSALEHGAPLSAALKWPPEVDGAYAVPRRDTHAWIALAGCEVGEVLSKMCAVDFHFARFANLSIAQTTLAGVAAIVLRWDRGGVPLFHLLADGTSAAYLWQTCLAVGACSGARAAGYNFLTRLGAQENSSS